MTYDYELAKLRSENNGLKEIIANLKNQNEKLNDENAELKEQIKAINATKFMVSNLIKYINLCEIIFLKILARKRITISPFESKFDAKATN